MLTCERAQDNLNEFLDGTLDAGHTIELSDHLESCRDCRGELAALKATVALLRTAPLPDLGAQHIHALRTFRRTINAVPEHRPVFRGLASVFASPKPRSGFRGATFASAALAAAAILAFAVYRMPAVENDTPPVPIVASAAPGQGLPSAGELDEMTSLHALQSCAFAPGDAGMQQDALADATSRLAHGDQ